MWPDARSTDRTPATAWDHVARARQRLRDAGIRDAEASRDARLLAQEVLGWDATRFFVSAGEAAPSDFDTRYERLVARRAAREPLAYITGRQEFWGLTFEVSPAVLIPRPETELLVEAALERFSDPAAGLRAADVCTGSGCLAVAIASERPGTRVTATDISSQALEMARRNVARHGLADRVELVEADLLDGVAQTFDLIVANPPYVLDRERPILQAEVREHEPAIALFGGDEGLSLIRRLVARAPEWLRPGGILMFEFGFAQEAAVTGLIAATPGLTLIGLQCDLQGIPRAAISRRTS